VEGAELEVLRGASELIKRDKPVMVIETRLENLREIADFLRNKGYQAYVSHFGGIHLVCLPHE